MNKKIVGTVFILGLLAAGIYLKYRHVDPMELPTLSERSGGATASSEFLNAQKAVAFYHDEIQKRSEERRVGKECRL